MTLSFLDFVLPNQQAFARCHQKASRVVESEVGLHHCPFVLGDDVAAISFYCFAQSPNHGVLSETTHYESFYAFLVLVELGW